MKTKLSFDIFASGPDLRLQTFLNGHCIWDRYPTAEIETLSHEFDDSTEQQHVLEFYMSGKLAEHTVIDDTGTILKDSCVHIANISFDDIQLGQLFNEVAHYHHDHNGTTDPVTQKFYGVMGCNGRAEMRFSTPIYLWLLENM